MSNPNNDVNFKKTSELVNIDETGKVVINDPELAKMTDELSEEELDIVSGGEVNISKCHCTVKLESEVAE